MPAATGRCMRCPTRRHPGWPRARAIRSFGPSRSWRWSWSPPPGRPRSRFGRAPTAPATLPKLSTWYLLTNLARPAGRRAQQTQLSEIVGAYGLRNWVEQGYKQVKDELGWADFQVRSARAIRRHWTLVCLAFSFCWHAGQPQAVTPGAGPAPPAATAAPPDQVAARGAQQRLDPGRRHR